MMRKDSGLSLDYCMPGGCKLKREFQQWYEKRIPYRKRGRNHGKYYSKKRKEEKMITVTVKAGYKKGESFFFVVRESMELEKKIYCRKLQPNVYRILLNKT